MSVREADDPVLFARVEAQNLLRQYDLLSNCVEITLAKGIEAFDKYTLWSLNAAATANIAQFGGRFRTQPIYVGGHIPPHFEKIPSLIDEFLSMIHENWTIATHPTVLPAYALWRLNWIHPFTDGNGRTSRALSYALLNIKLGYVLPGFPTIPQQIETDNSHYIEALEMADEAARNGAEDISEMEQMIRGMLAKQLVSVIDQAGGKI